MFCGLVPLVALAQALCDRLEMPGAPSAAYI